MRHAVSTSELPCGMVDDGIQRRLRKHSVTRPPDESLDFKGSELRPREHERNFAAERLLWRREPVLGRVTVSLEATERSAEEARRSRAGASSDSSSRKRPSRLRRVRVRCGMFAEDEGVIALDGRAVRQKTLEDPEGQASFHRSNDLRSVERLQAKQRDMTVRARTARPAGRRGSARTPSSSTAWPRASLLIWCS